MSSGSEALRNYFKLVVNLSVFLNSIAINNKHQVFYSGIRIALLTSVSSNYRYFLC